MVKHTKNIRRLLLTNCLSGLIFGLKGLFVTITQLSLKREFSYHSMANQKQTKVLVVRVKSFVPGHEALD